MGKTAREMNVLFREHGYLDGEPGNYSMTPKGSQYGSETSYERGTGGYSFYNASWDVRTWDEDIVEALNADMAAAASETSPSDEPVATIDAEDEYENQAEIEPQSRSWSPVVLGVAALVLVGGAVVATSPRVHRWAEEEAKPRAQRAWRALTRRGQLETPTPDPVPVPGEVVEPADMLEIEVPDSELE